MSSSNPQKKTKQLKYAENTQSVQVIDRRRDAIELFGGLAALSESAAAALEERLQTVLEEGEEMPDVRHLLRLLGRLVENEDRELDAVDEERWLAGMRLSCLRQEAREARGELYGEVVKVRRVLVGLYGSKRCRFQLGLSKRTPRGAENLLLEAGRLVRRLSSPTLNLPAPLGPGVVADPAGWVAALRPGYQRLDRLLRAIERRKIGSGDQVLARQRALESFDQTYLLVVHALEALCALAGKKELGRRLRAGARRRAASRRGRRLAAAVKRTVAKPASAMRTAVTSISGWLGWNRRNRGLRSGRVAASGRKPRRRRWHGPVEELETVPPPPARRGSAAGNRAARAGTKRFASRKPRRRRPGRWFGIPQSCSGKPRWRFSRSKCARHA